ncbi:MAG TPA: hypothetical protein VNP73_01865 [Actinomycetota bacterium]|nr:hypothetical protein [Actinomycetota bacterium]
MAIYRPPKARWPLALGTGIASLLIGAAIGLAIGTQDPDPVESAQALRSTLVAAAGSIEVAAIEYEEAVVDGTVEREAEYEGSLAALDSSNARYREVRSALELLAPEAADEIDSLFGRCRSLMEETADAERVTECLADLELVLTGS